MFNLQRIYLFSLLTFTTFKSVAAGPLFVSFDADQFPLAAAYESAHVQALDSAAEASAAAVIERDAREDYENAVDVHAQAQVRLSEAEQNLLNAQMTNDPDLIRMAEEAVQQANEELAIADAELQEANQEFLAARANLHAARTRVRQTRAFEDRSRRDYEVGATDQQNPLIPNAMDGESFVFNDVPSGLFVDPPTASGFEYTMLSSSLFTQILAFPTGFSDPFTVSAGGTNYGQFNVGETLTFDGGGVSSFTVTGINPLVDPTLLDAFPLQLEYNTPTASFTMTPINSSAVPEPSSLALLGMGAFGFIGYGWRRKRKLAA